MEEGRKEGRKAGRKEERKEGRKEGRRDIDNFTPVGDGLLHTYTRGGYRLFGSRRPTLVETFSSKIISQLENRRSTLFCRPL